MIKLALPIFFLISITAPTTCNKKSQIKENNFSEVDILVQSPWIVDELYHVISGKSSYYLRGETNNTGIDYNRLKFVFNKNGTGTTTQDKGDEYSFIWKLNKDEKTLQLTVNYNSPMTYMWRLVQITDKYLHATVPLTINGNRNNLESFRLIQEIEK